MVPINDNDRPDFTQPAGKPRMLTKDRRSGPIWILEAFVAGALSVLVFQFGLGAILFQVGLSPIPPYPMDPVPPLGVPQSLNLAFWGGLWGIVLRWVLDKTHTEFAYWTVAALFGGIVLSAVLLFVVMPIKGSPVAAGWNMRVWLLVFVLHATFGLGTALFLRISARVMRT